MAEAFTDDLELRGLYIDELGQLAFKYGVNVDSILISGQGEELSFQIPGIGKVNYSTQFMTDEYYTAYTGNGVEPVRVTDDQLNTFGEG